MVQVRLVQAVANVRVKDLGHVAADQVDRGGRGSTTPEGVDLWRAEATKADKREVRLCAVGHGGVRVVAAPADDVHTRVREHDEADVGGVGRLPFREGRGEVDQV